MKMLKHIVMWRFKDQAQGKSKQENLQIFKQGLERLPSIIPQIVSMQVGLNACESDAAYDMVLILTIKNEADLAIYANHPEHLKVREFCKNVRESRVVVDFFE